MKVYRNILFLWRETWKLRKTMVVLFIIRLLLETVEPFITIIFPSLILNELQVSPRMQRIGLYIICMVGAFFLIRLVLHIVQYKIITEDMRIGNAFGNSCSYKQMTMAYKNCEKNDILNKISQFYFPIQPNSFLQTVGQCLSSILQVIICVFIGLFLDWPILLVLIGFLIIQNIIMRRMKKVEYTWNGKKASFTRRFEYFGRIMTEYENAKELRVYHGSDWLSDKYKKLLSQYSIRLKRFAIKQAYPSLALTICDVLQQGIFYGYFAFRVLFSGLLIGNFNMMLTTASQLQSAVVGMLSSFSNVRQLSQYIDLYKEYLSIVKADESNGVASMPETGISLEFKNVSFTYPDTEQTVLKHVSFVIRPGQHTAIIGPNGSGKTTIVKLICRLYEPTEGQILLNGKNIADYDRADYVRHLSVLLQDYKLLAFSVRDNIVFDYKADDAEIWECLVKSGLAGKVRALSEGLDTILFKDFSPDGIELSGGESQKLVLARELYKNGSFLILDEPTASLDPIAEYEFYNGLKDLAGEKTCLYISHRLYSVKFSDYILVFQDGELVEEGTHEELINKNGFYYEMFTKQASLYR